MIIQSVFLSGGGMLKAIDFPLCSFDIHPNESIHDPLSEGESWLVVTYYYRLTSHSHYVYGAEVEGALNEQQNEGEQWCIVREDIF